MRIAPRLLGPRKAKRLHAKIHAQHALFQLDPWIKHIILYGQRPPRGTEQHKITDFRIDLIGPTMADDGIWAHIFVMSHLAPRPLQSQHVKLLDMDDHNTTHDADAPDRSQCIDITDHMDHKVEVLAATMSIVGDQAPFT